MDELEKVAYHEAGHVVMHVLYGLRFNYVTIEPDDECLGRVHGRYAPWFRPDVDNSHYVAHHSEAQIMTFLAGPVAEEIATGEEAEEFSLVVDGDDVSKAMDLALRMKGGGDEASAYLDELRGRAEDDVDTSWHLVEAVAAALLARRFLREEDAYDLMFGAA